MWSITYSSMSIVKVGSFLFSGRASILQKPHGNLYLPSYWERIG